MAESIDFKALDLNPYLQWSDVSGIDWKEVPQGIEDEYKLHARRVAGRARSFHPYLLPAAHDYAMKLERWLIDYELKHRPQPKQP